MNEDRDEREDEPEDDGEPNDDILERQEMEDYEGTWTNESEHWERL